MGAAGLRREARDHDVRPEEADDAHDVAQDRLAIPDAQCFLIILGKPEIDRPGEILPAAVELSRGQQFLGAGHAERIAEMRAKQILAALASGER